MNPRLRERLRPVVERLASLVKGRRRRWLIWGLVALLAYPVLGTITLASGLLEWMLRSEKLSVELDGFAYTLWPGRVQLPKLRISLNSSVQLSLEAEQVSMDVVLHELVLKRLHVQSATGSAVRYRMRLRSETEHGRPARVAAFPPLAGLPPGKATPPGKKKSGWSVVAEGLNVAIAELWFFEYRYLGGGSLRGAFEVGPGVMRVTSATQNFVRGEVRFGREKRLLERLEGKVAVDIAELDPKAHGDKSFFRFVSGRVEARGDLLSLANVNAYFDELDVSGGAGPVQALLVVERGSFAPVSRLDYRTDAVKVKYGQVTFESDAAALFEGAGEQGRMPLARVSSQLSRLSVARDQAAFTVESQGQHFEGALDSLRLTGESRFERAELRLPRISSADLRDLGAVLPESWPLEMHGGKLTSSLTLQVDRDWWARGASSLQLTGYGLTVAGVSVGGNLTYQGQLELNARLGVYRLQDSKLQLRETRVRNGSERSDGWWLDASSQRVELRAGKQASVEATVVLRARDLEPVLEALSERNAISGLIPRLVSLHDFRSKLTLRARSPMLDIVMASESDVWDASGRFLAEGERKHLALLVGGEAISLGVASHRGETSVMPFAKSGWLDEQLARFPRAPVALAR
jgi:hypothetical protein